MRVSLYFKGQKTINNVDRVEIELPFNHRLEVIDTKENVEVLMHYPKGKEPKLFESILKVDH